jgi:ketosteroid isomerase-like protein
MPGDVRVAAWSAIHSPASGAYPYDQERQSSMAGGSFDDVLVRQRDALRAFMRGDTQAFKELYSRKDDATLANPFGGVARGWNEISERLDRAASYYVDGEVLSIETVATDHSDDFGYAIEIERVRARVGDREVFDEVALRTTTVYRRENAGWKLVHRHADPAVDIRGPETILASNQQGLGSTD